MGDVVGDGGEVLQERAEAVQGQAGVGAFGYVLFLGMRGADRFSLKFLRLAACF